jgi:hypothetical protein
MPGDYSRESFDSLRDYAALYLQQGHPVTDADFNELVAMLDRDRRAATVDIIGRATVSLETPAGFQITPAAGPALTIGRGRIYVDGIKVENHGTIDADNPPAFDRERIEAGRAVGVLDEAISAAANDAVDYLEQPYWPEPDPLPESDDSHLAYLRVWRREVTPLKDPSLLDVALGGIDTATRWQTVWQVRLLEDVGTGTTCGSPLDAWDDLVLPSAARLTTDTIEFEDPDDPCLIPPGGGYRGLENQYYRVEIHDPGPLGEATFKWSRDNASVGTTIESFTDDSRINVRRLGRDTVLRIETGDWVEVTDNIREFAGLPGDLRRVEVEHDTGELRFADALSPDLVPTGINGDTAAARHSRVIKWDQSGPVLEEDGTVWHDLDDGAATGAIPIPADGRLLVLEAGITVSFSTIDETRQLRSIDYWTFAARTATADIERLTKAPPRGIHFHYARLAIVTFPNGVVNCRTFWPPAFGEGEECGCTVCVSAEGHNSGTLTIQQAIAQLPAEGGTVCLGPGDFQLGQTPVTISGRRSTRLKGHGGATALVFVGAGNAAIDVTSATDVAVSDMSIAALAISNDSPSAAAIRLRDTSGARIDRVSALGFGVGDSVGTAVLLEGFQLDTMIDACQLVGQNGILARADRERQVPFTALFETTVSNCTIVARRGIALLGDIFHLGAVDIRRNVIFATQRGIVADGVAVENGGWSAAALRIEDNGIGVTEQGGEGITVSLQDMRIADNEIVGRGVEGESAGGGNAIRIATARLDTMLLDAQVVGNRLGRFAGHGVLVEAQMDTLLVKRNVIRDCGAGGFTMAPTASVRHLALDNNHVERIGGLPGAEPVSGVRIQSAFDAQVIGNLVRTVGGGGDNDLRPQYWAGIEIRGSVSVDVSDNLVEDVGSARSAGIAGGVLLLAPFASATLHHNQVVDTRAPIDGDALDWTGIVIGGVRSAGTRTPGRATNFTTGAAAVEVEGRLMSFSTIGIVDIGRLREPEAIVTGNRVSDGHSASRIPLVSALLAGDGTLNFGSNIVRLDSGGGDSDAIVTLAARRVDASHNTVRRNNDLDAMHITTANTGGERALAIVIGNMTMGNIRLNGSSLNSPFADLNILA